MSRRSRFAMGAAAVTLLSLVASPLSAHAEYDYVPYRACVIADYGAWMHVRPCYGDDDDEDRQSCVRPVRRGLAFRVLRQKGGYLLVRSRLQRRGWIELNSLRLAPQAYCRAAGI